MRTVSQLLKARREEKEQRAFEREHDARTWINGREVTDERRAHQNLIVRRYNRLIRKARKNA